LLSFDEIERLTRAFVKFGVTKLRLTGGEPLLRPNLAELVARLASIDGITDIALTTNGFLLHKHAHELKKAGLQRLNISLDALDVDTFRQLSGTNHTPAAILDGLAVAQAAGFGDIKFNAVVKRGTNHNEIMPLVERFRNSAVTLRFIEYMDVGTLNDWTHAAFIPAREIIAEISTRYEIEPVEPAYLGEVAKLYRYRDGAGYVGFITSISQPFCRDCVRARLTADGKLITCLFGTDGADLRQMLRAGITDTDLIAKIQQIWEQRDVRYSELRQDRKTAKRTAKIEMYQVGG
jgi:cyclic pyranopterin phosphate synthase